MKFCETEGEVNALTKTNKNFVSVNIIDNGIGIKKDHLEHIFGIFNQAKSGLVRESDGKEPGIRFHPGRRLG